MTRPVGVLVAGAGRAGMVHARNFAAGVPGAVLVGIADPDDGARSRAFAELGCDLCAADPVAAATDERVDAVVIATPTFTHAEIAAAALSAGRHVLCEKPLAATLEEADRLAAAASTAEGAFLMGFMRRFDAGFRDAADRITAGEIGEPLLVRSTGRGPGLPPEWAWDPARSGGLIAEVNSHDLDSIRWLSGQEPVRVHAVGRAAKRPDLAERYPGFVDVVAATFTLSAGAIAQVDGACPADYGYDARVEVYGSEGVVFAGSAQAGTAVVVRKDGVVGAPVRSWRELFAEAYRAEDRHLVAVVRGEAAPVTTVADGVAALEAVVATNRSLATGAPVALAEVRG